MGNPPNAPWPPQPGHGGRQPPYGPPPPQPGGPAPGMPARPGWQPGPPPPGRKGGGGLLVALLGGGLVLVLIVVGAVVLVVQNGDGGGGDGGVRLKVGKIAGGAEARPLADGSLIMARPGVTTPVVDIYEDFACPPCGGFDRKHDPMLKQIAVAGDAKVVFHPMLIFGEANQPAHDNSLRAASALRCVYDGAHWLSYQDALYAHQPADENATGYTTEELLSYAEPLGLTGDEFTSCVREQRYADSVQTVSRQYVSSGIRGTPSVRVNGRTLSSSETKSPAALRSAIEAAS